jgi:hypothetical protein
VEATGLLMSITATLLPDRLTMTRYIAVLALILGLAVPPRAFAQAGTCRSNDGDAKLLRDWAARVSNDTDSYRVQQRADYHVPAGGTARLVSDSSVCAAAALAYARYIAHDSTITTTTRSVYVVEIAAGSQKTYVVLDPDESYSGGWGTNIFFSDDFTKAYGVIAA